MNGAAHIPPGMLQRIILDKQAIIVYYEHLLQLTATDEYWAAINQIFQDEICQLKLFKDLYTELFSQSPELPVREAPVISSFKDGVTYSIAKEKSMYRLYGNIYFTDPSALVRDTFFRAIYDENIHSIELVYIFSGI